MKLLILGFLFIIHPIKMSFSRMNYLPDSRLRIETKFFLDDLSLHLKNKYRLKEIDFTEHDSNGIESLQRYLDHKLYVEQNGKKIKFLIESASIDTDSVSIQINMVSESKLDKKIGFTMNNELMLDIFKKQKNIVKFYENKSLKSKKTFSISESKIKIHD